MLLGQSVSIPEGMALQELVLCTGHEQENRDIGRGLDLVLLYGDIEIEPLERQALGSLLDGLQYATRFRGEPTFAEGAGENSATHSLHVARMMVAVVKAAAERVMPPQEGQGGSALTKDFISDAVVASFLHDMGEMFGEFSTVRERVEQGSGRIEESSAEVERLIFISSAQLALHLAYQKRAGDFISTIQSLRETIGPVISSETVAAIFEPHLPDSLVPEAQKVLDRWVKLYDATEGLGSPTAEDRFLGNCVKMVERLQGGLHYIRLSRKSPTLVDFPVEGRLYEPWPSSQTQALRHTEEVRSHYLFAKIARFEDKLGEILQLAADGLQIAVAKELWRRGYEAILEELEVGPMVVRRSLQDPNPAVTRRIREAQSTDEVTTALKEEYALLLGEHKAARAAPEDPTQLLPVETRLRLQALYRKALELGYEPSPGEILGLRETIPSELVPLEPATSRMSRRRAI